MPYPSLEALMEDLVAVIVAAIQTDNVHLPNHRYYWRWVYLEADRLHHLFPDIQERLDREHSEHFIPAGQEDKVFVHQLERWYQIDFSDAREQVVRILTP